MRITILNFNGNGLKSAVEHLNLKALVGENEVSEFKISNFYSNECFNAIKEIEIYNQNEGGGGNNRH